MGHGLAINGLACGGNSHQAIAQTALATGLVAGGDGVTAVFLVRYFTPVSFLLYGFIGMAVSVLTGLLCSLVMPAPKDLRGLTWKTLQR